MARKSIEIDPAWAWSPYEPNDEHPWNRGLAAHLYRRAGYGANSRQLDEAVEKTPREVVQQLLSAGEQATQLQDDIDQLGRTMLASGDAKKLAAWWLYRAINTPDQLGDKMVLFWHGHFATSADKVPDAALMYQQHLTLHQHALGHFEPLVQAISRDPAMLVYLDSTTNRKRHPNENYARELMELFCLGLDQYTEHDIGEIARCFTGWEVRRGAFRFNPYQHDTGSKSFLDESGRFGGEDAVRIVVDQPACPKFITRKLVRYFVSDEVAIPNALVEPLARDFRQSGLNVARLVERILTSQLFFSAYSVSRKVRSPIELAVGLLRCLQGTTNTLQLAEEVAALGQSLFHPPSVKGWEGGRAWINSSTVLGRANLVSRILEGKNTRFGGGNLSALVASYDLQGEEFIDWLLELLLAVPVNEQVRQRLVETEKSAQGNPSRKLAEVVYAIALLPEFQLA